MAEQKADPFSNLFDSYKLTESDALPAPMAPSPRSASSPPPFSSASAINMLDPSAPSSFSSSSSSSPPPSSASPSLLPAAKKKIRKLPRSVVKAGEYGAEYEKWRQEQDEMEQRALREALTPLQGVVASSSASSAVSLPASSAGPPAKSPRRQGGPKKEGGKNKMRIELVERGVPKKLWFLCRWLVAESTAADGDVLILFEEQVRGAAEIWRLKLTHKKNRGSTHCAVGDLTGRKGRFFAVYENAQGEVVCQSPTVVLGPKAEIRAEIRGQSIVCKCLMDPAAQSGWDWVGIFHVLPGGGRCSYADFSTWSYVDWSKNGETTLDCPVTPSDYMCCLFSASKKWIPMAISNELHVPDVNSVQVAGDFVAGGMLHVSINMTSFARESNDWIGLYLATQFKKHQYLASATCLRDRAEVELKIPDELPPEGATTGYCVRYVSTLAGPLTGGAIISSSSAIQIAEKKK